MYTIAQSDILYVAVWWLTRCGKTTLKEIVTNRFNLGIAIWCAYSYLHNKLPLDLFMRKIGLFWAQINNLKSTTTNSIKVFWYRKNTNLLRELLCILQAQGRSKRLEQPRAQSSQTIFKKRVAALLKWFVWAQSTPFRFTKWLFSGFGCSLL